MSAIPFRTVGVVANAGKPESRGRLVQLQELLAQHQQTVLFDPGAATLLGISSPTPINEIGQRADLVIVLGGDGTLLRTVREVGEVDTPLCGVNVGNLGFLTAVRGEELAQSLTQILRGEYAVNERHLLQCALQRNGQIIAQHRALNDVVISRSTFSRVVRLRVSLDSELLTEYVCDGMIFATATGSTAYSLSAGGPILMPNTRAFVITPICPHALSNRSVIAGRNSVAHCQVASAAGELLVTVDGQVQARMQVGDTLEVRRAGRTVRMVTPKGHSFFDVLRQKLKWSGANV